MVGDKEHQAALQFALEKARSSVAIVSPSVSSLDVFADLAGVVSDAVRRGIRVDILVGRTDSGVNTSELVAIANRVGYQADNQNGRSRLRTRHPATGSGASLLLYDDQNGDLVGLIGDYDWLGGTDSAKQALGVRLTEANLCGDLGRAVGSLWVGTRAMDGDFAGSAERWRHLASAAEERAAALEVAQPTASSPDETSAELLVDDEHAEIGQDRDGLALVGGHLADPDAGPGGARGLTLRLTDPGAALIAAARRDA